LGLKLIVKALPRYARFECLNGNSTFSLHESGESGTNNIWLYFETETLDDDVDKFQRKGIVFESLPTDQSWLWREARLKDPDGNLLILYYAGVNRKDPPWRLH
ncbi:VOC family protein, partial [Chitinophaga sp.]|uniref:VOC family protein n=1 Tax=Chitinophaga sp. TaxID=1869181 RepID=UPI002C30C4EE